MNKDELLNLLVLLARYVEIYQNDSGNKFADVYEVVSRRLLTLNPALTAIDIFNIVNVECHKPQVDDSLLTKTIETNQELITMLRDMQKQRKVGEQ